MGKKREPWKFEKTTHIKGAKAIFTFCTQGSTSVAFWTFPFDLDEKISEDVDSFSNVSFCFRVCFPFFLSLIADSKICIRNN